MQLKSYIGRPARPEYTAAAMLIVCDFDGTITTHDCLNLIVQRFAPQAWATIEPRLRAGEITLLDAIVEEFRHVKVTEEEAVDCVLQGTQIRAGFPEFVEWAEDNGYDIVVVSAGFEVLITPMLAAAGLSRLPVYSGDATFTREGTEIAYPSTTRECASCCGMCKKDVVEELAHKTASPKPLVHIGDGLSDLCVAREADSVFARGSLARLLDKEGIPYRPFEDFFEVRRVLESSFPR